MPGPASGGPGPAAFKVADLPGLPRGFFRLVGPGVVVVGLAIGAGELVVWPIMTARFGASIAWAAVLGLTLQLFINLEVCRYTLATGESAFSAFARLGRFWVPAFLLLTVAGWILPGWARTCAGALKAVTVGPGGPGQPWQWTALTFAAVSVVMFGPKNAYRSIERITVVLVAVMLAGLVLIALRLANGPALVELGRGIMAVGHKPAELPAYELFSAIVFAGAGGTANLMLSYYIIKKGWGMAAAEEDGAGPYEIRDSAANREHWTRWMRHVRRDQAIFFWGMNTATILLFILASLVVLHAGGIVPSREMLLLEEAAILGSVWGGLGAGLFMAVGIACLFSTQLVLLDGVARSCADLLATNYAWARKLGERSCYRRTALAWMLAGTALTWAWSSLPPFVFLLSAGFFGGIAMACYCPLLLVANRRLLPPACRPGVISQALMLAVSLFYLSFAAVSVWVAGMKLLA